MNDLNELQIYVRQLEEENLRLKQSNKALKNNNKVLLEGQKKLQSQIGRFKSERIRKLKEKIKDYRKANDLCIEEAEKNLRADSIKYFQNLNFALDTVENFMKELGL